MQVCNSHQEEGFLLLGMFQQMKHEKGTPKESLYPLQSILWSLSNKYFGVEKKTSWPYISLEHSKAVDKWLNVDVSWPHICPLTAFKKFTDFLALVKIYSRWQFQDNLDVRKNPKFYPLDILYSRVWILKEGSLSGLIPELKSNIQFFSGEKVNPLQTWTCSNCPDLFGKAFWCN